MKTKIIFSWSGGKDSSLALHELIKSDQYEVVSLLTTMTEGYDRISMHGVRRTLVEAQAESIGIPIEMVYITQGANNAEYEQKMGAALKNYKDAGIEKIVFGDIFLEDLKAYRETNLSKVGISTVFPLWKKDTKALITEFLDLGFKAIVVCASAKHLSEDFVGKTLTKELIENLPEDVDVCGENGEFHTFCYDGPIFKTPVPFSIGEKIYREYDTPNTINEKTGFWFCDLY